MKTCPEAQIGRLQKRAKLARQTYLSDRNISNRWLVSLLWPAASRLARARAEVSADHSWEYAIALEAQIAQLSLHVKNVEGCLTHLGSARNQEHLDEMIAILREDGLHSLSDH